MSILVGSLVNYQNGPDSMGVAEVEKITKNTQGEVIAVINDKQQGRKLKYPISMLVEYAAPEAITAQEFNEDTFNRISNQVLDKVSDSLVDDLSIVESLLIHGSLAVYIGNLRLALFGEADEG